VSCARCQFHRSQPRFASPQAYRKEEEFQAPGRRRREELNTSESIVCSAELIDRLVDGQQNLQALSLGRVLTNQVTCLRGCRRPGSGASAPTRFPFACGGSRRGSGVGRWKVAPSFPTTPESQPRSSSCTSRKQSRQNRFTTKPNVPSTLASPHKEIAYFRKPIIATVPSSLSPPYPLPGHLRNNRFFAPLKERPRL
jgi:hypothetical protein